MLTTEPPVFPFATPPDLDTDPVGLRMLDHAPVGMARLDGRVVWLALGYRANRVVMSDPRVHRDDAPEPACRSAGITAHSVDRLRPRLEIIAEALLDDLARAEPPVDLKRDYADRLAGTAVRELLGVDRQDLGAYLAGVVEATASRLTNGIVALSRNPDQFDLLRSRPDLAPQAAEELARWDKLISTTVPWTTVADLDIEGHVIPAGAAVIAVPHIGNRDAAVFEDPNRFDILRPNANQHLSFTDGPHFCLGSTLARAGSRIGLAALVGRFPKLEIAVGEAELRWREGRAIRSLEELPVRW